MRNYSKQRELIYNILKSTKEHPTAEWIYFNARQHIPQISLGTVYRNLLTLEEDGLITKITNINGKDRYDADVLPHAHIACKKCGCLLDIEIDKEILNIVGQKGEDKGFLEYTIVYKGLCDSCKNQNNN